MRTIDSTAAAALLAGEGTFTARMVPSGLGASVVVYAYEINGLSMTFRCAELSGWVGTQFTFTRELSLGGTTYSITAENYYMVSYQTKDGISSGIAHAIEKTGYDGPADVSVYDLVKNIFGAANVFMDNNIYPFFTQFAPTGATITLANKADIIPMLERKYFVRCFRNGGKLLFRNIYLAIQEIIAVNPDIPSTEMIEFPTQADCVNFRTFEGAPIQIAISAIDETGATAEYYTPPTDLPIQNVGFLPSTTPAANVADSATDNVPLWAFEGRPVYKYEDGDNVWLPFRPDDAPYTALKIIERYNKGTQPPLQMTYSDIQWRPSSSASSRGINSPLSRVGADGISLEASQLLTGILDQNTTDVQHALELLSIHTHTGAGTGDMTKAEYDPDDNQVIAIENGGTGGTTMSEARANLGITTEDIQDAAGIMVTSGTKTGITVTYDDANNVINFTVSLNTLYPDNYFYQRWIGPVITTISDPAYVFKSAGDRFLLSTSGLVGEFIGKENYIAYWDGSVWSYHQPTQEGETFYLQSNNVFYTWDGDSWEAMRTYALTHAGDHITGGVDIIPVATATETGLVPILSNNAAQFLDGTGNWTSPTGGGVFQRILNANLTLADGESLVLSSYINLGDYNLTLDGDAELHIL